MKKIIIFLIYLIVTFYSLNSKSNIRFYGQFETKYDMIHKTDYYNKEYQAFGWGLNNYANLRLKSDINEYLTFNLAVNINMLAGSYTDVYRTDYMRFISSAAQPGYSIATTDNLFSIPFYSASTYIGSFDIERLYFKAGYKFFDIQTGLLRIARGYGYAFSPIDIFNPKNPVNPDARPVGKLSFVTTFYPMDLWKIEGFIIAPDNPIKDTIWGLKIGTATNFNIDKLNFEFLYTLFFPEMEYLKDQKKLNKLEYINNDYSHVFGFSMKADVVVGLFIDAIYRLEHRVIRERNYYGKELYFYRGLEAAIGIDYTINIPGTNSNIYLLLEYMFYGSGMLDWWQKDLNDLYYEDNIWQDKSRLERISLLRTDIKHQNFLRHDYIFGMIKYKINTYVTPGISYMFGADDQSGLLSPFVEIEPFQAFTITVKATYPLGWEIINHQYPRGEFGPTNIGYYQNYSVSVKFRF